MIRTSKLSTEKAANSFKNPLEAAQTFCSGLRSFRNLLAAQTYSGFLAGFASFNVINRIAQLLRMFCAAFSRFSLYLGEFDIMNAQLPLKIVLISFRYSIHNFFSLR